MARESNPFWRHSLQIYRRPGVQSACLVLQETCGADVNVLLLCCWLGHGGRALDRRELRRAMAAAAPWQRDVVRPLRLARRALKTAVPPHGQAEQTTTLRRRILALELDAERIEQGVLFAWACALPARARSLPPETAAWASLQRYGGLLGAADGAHQAVSAKLRALAGAAAHLP